MNPNSQATLQLVKDALAAPHSGLSADLSKAITTGTGLVAFDLQAPALSLIPVITPIRNRTPRVKANGGTATNWKAVTGINTSLLDLGVSEGNRGASVVTSTASYVATYKGLGLEDSVTFEADDASEGFQDVKATAALNLLRAVMIGEEFLLLAGNASNALGTTPTPTLVASASGGTMATQGAASVICVALTPDGYRRSSLAGGVPPAAITKTNTDASTDTVNPGVAQKSANAVVSVTGATGSIAATVAAVTGAAGYAWYCGATATTERLAAITTINSVVLTSYPGSGQLASALAAADLSVNANIFDGLLTIAQKAGSNAYLASLATGVAGTGTVLTSDGAGGITQLTAAFQYFWDNYRLSPDTIWVSGTECVNITKKIIANSGAPLFRITQDATAAHAVTGGVRVTGVLNPITGTMVDLLVHPNLVQGTILFTTSSIPYPMNGIGNVWQVKTRREYYQLDWPLRSRKTEYGVYVDEVLQHYAPFSLGVISNVANG